MKVPPKPESPRSSIRLYYEHHHLCSIDEHGRVHKPNGRAGSASSVRCEDCELRNALTATGLPLFCSDCRAARTKGKKRCLNESCANGCEACGGTGRVRL